MDFFKILSQIGAGIDISIRIKEKDGILSVMVTPEAGNKTRLDGKILTGTAQEIDISFFPSITPVLDNARGVIAQDVKGDASKKEKEEKPKPEKSDPKAGKSKGAKDKNAKQAKKKNAPAVQERSMFDQPADLPATETAEVEQEEEAAEEEQPETDNETDSETE